MDSKAIILLAVSVVMVVGLIYCVLFLNWYAQSMWNSGRDDVQYAYDSSHFRYNDLDGQTIRGSSVKYYLLRTDTLEATDAEGNTGVFYVGENGELFSFYVSTKTYREQYPGTTMDAFGNSVADDIPSFTDFTEMNNVDDCRYVDAGASFHVTVNRDESNGMLKSVYFEEV